MKIKNKMSEIIINDFFYISQLFKVLFVTTLDAIGPPLVRELQTTRFNLVK